ncbi:magnesium or manganese-dependent protein phosphatase [Streptomyces sviceus ATCC 29083]|uniref:Magnesium or manganese-dependent protein phosphatase n=1 Tax=Streptomyces sviceus (strain ATCC 29083 / DSM 924 / JCM 4929 / NBRC 13980 / NCIMB 11184 / NRRL 5439 / UC 5370) TaxID=463191 RepID=D6XC78_STRX2|nr:magnesium or manganese-dependent protein phosphatase [Streptomyces sviceus ATCC 29083]
MGAAGIPTSEGGEPPRGAVRPSGLLDELGMASVVLDAKGHIVLWSPQAEELFGYGAREALGQYAAHLMIHEQHSDLVVKLFADVMETGQSWAGAFPVRRKDGATKLVEFRNMRLLDDRGDVYALGLCADQSTVRRLERDVALSTRMISQSPIGLAVLDTELRYVSVNPALELMNGVPAEEHVGRKIGEVLPHLDVAAFEAAAREVLRTGKPLVDQHTVGRTPADPDTDHAWSVSLYRLEDALGTVLGVAGSVLDVTEQHLATVEAETARRRLALVADASARIGTTLDLDRTARELADVAVPELADVAAVDLLEAVVQGRPSTLRPTEPAVMRPLAVEAAGAPDALGAADPPGQVARYAPERLVTECVRTGTSVLVAQVGPEDLVRIARSPEAAALLARAGVHSYLAVPTDRARRGARRPRPQARPQSGALRRGRPAAGPGAGGPRGGADRQRPLVPGRPQHRSHPPAQPAAQPSGGDRRPGGRLPLPARGRHRRGRRRLVRRHPARRGQDRAGRGRCDGQRHQRRRDHGPAAHRDQHPGLPRPGPGQAPRTPRPDHRGPGPLHRHLRVRRARSGPRAVPDRQRRAPASGAAAPRPSPPNCSNCPRGRRWAWAVSPSPPPPSTSHPVTVSSCTRTVSSRPASIRSTSAWTHSSTCSTPPTGRWRRSATCCCAHCTSRTTPTTWRC